MKEFTGEYLGGHVDYPDVGPVLLQLNDESLFVAPYSPLSHMALGQPFLTIPYANIASVQSVPYEKISTLRFLTFGAATGLFWRKNEHLLTVTFKDDLGIEQTVAFKLKQVEKAHTELYNRIAKPKKTASVPTETKKTFQSVHRARKINRGFKILLGILVAWGIVFPLAVTVWHFISGFGYGWSFYSIFTMYSGAYYSNIATILLGISIAVYIIWRCRRPSINAGV
jgi:hypothetical protein